MDLIGAIDASFAAFLAPLWRVVLWGVFSGGASMGLYVLLLPQRRLLVLKQAQREARANLIRHQGDWKELQTLIAKDLSLSFKHLALVVLPVLVSVAPLAWLISQLEPLYPDFLFPYCAGLLVTSLAIKIVFKIS